MRVGLVGPNGSGKTTLLRLLLGENQPATGKIQRASVLRIVYFDQTRQLDESGTLRRALAPDSDSVIYQDRVIHVAAWAARFLFTSEQLNQPVSRLSGGERARVLIAQLMLQPADLLLLDEPTNDLDIPTLEILEESLLEYRGALVLVTHDRYLLDRVSTVVLGLDGQGMPKVSPTTRNGMTGSGNRRKTSNLLLQEKSGAAPTRKCLRAAKKLSYLDARTTPRSSTASPMRKLCCRRSARLWRIQRSPAMHPNSASACGVGRRARSCGIPYTRVGRNWRAN